MRPRTARPHVGYGGLLAVEGAGQIDREDALPLFSGDLAEPGEESRPALVTMISIGPS
jgi:hypothetical protein